MERCDAAKPTVHSSTRTARGPDRHHPRSVGDAFANREQRLPTRPGRHYYEADLDFACGKRNADRLIYSNDGLRFVTTDHYQSFHEVPK